MLSMILRFFQKDKSSVMSADTFDLRGRASFLPYLDYLSRTKGFAFPKNKTLAAKYGVTERTIRRWLHALQESGKIRVETRGPKRKIFMADVHVEKNVRVKRTECPGSVRVRRTECPPVIRERINSFKETDVPRPRTYREINEPYERRHLEELEKRRKAREISMKNQATLPFDFVADEVEMTG